MAVTRRIMPPESCEIPVIHKGEEFFTIRSLIMPEITVQTEDKMIITSAYEKLILLPVALIAIIPANPIKPPMSLFGLNFSLLINKKAKHTYNNCPDCFNSAVFELSASESPM